MLIPANPVTTEQATQRLQLLALKNLRIWFVEKRNQTTHPSQMTNILKTRKICQMKLSGYVEFTGRGTDFRRGHCTHSSGSAGPEGD